MAELASQKAYPTCIDKTYPHHDSAFAQWCTGRMPSEEKQLDRYIEMLEFLISEESRIQDALEYFRAVKAFTIDKNIGVPLESFLELGVQQRDACLRVHVNQSVQLGTLSSIQGSVGDRIRQIALEKMQPPAEANT